MIYKKEANFPYPVLTPGTNSYKDCYFDLNIELKDDAESYRFYVNYELECDFLNTLLEEKKAEIIFVVQSKDNKFFKLDNKYIDIKKTRISLSKRTSVQLLIKAVHDISFALNNELSEFYSEFKEEIEVDKNSVLAFSNICILDGRLKDPLKIFEKKHDPDLKSDIKFHLSKETIVITFKKSEYQFPGIRNKEQLNNAYIYMGLQRALTKFLQSNVKEKGDEYIDINEIDPPENLLDLKLYNLMKSKTVEILNSDNIDEVIYKITDRMIEKYYTAVKELSSDGN
ncbi:hypothetical protein [Oceanirhabdus sp. W0125-5]|uniref:hypothetical protein n=1 Tax=Oceanirhabdus sp. W0125-5 TaxID=2999116 RepID=UPI0022F33F35|nr:hypothetical protein [Oceanirhabdus sp. W0125-5]WBW96242.1 hypothetical protein OW730_21495 [Oceanirhabdus sp. W0125-5]